MADVINMNSSDVVVGGTGAASQYNNVRKDIRLGVRDSFTEVDAATVTIDLSHPLIRQLTLGGNRTLAISNAVVGQFFYLELIQDATGGRTVTWFPNIDWFGGGIAPVLSSVGNKKDAFFFRCKSIVSTVPNFDGFIVGTNGAV